MQESVMTINIEKKMLQLIFNTFKFIKNISETTNIGLQHSVMVLSANGTEFEKEQSK